MPTIGQRLDAKRKELKVPGVTNIIWVLSQQCYRVVYVGPNGLPKEHVASRLTMVHWETSTMIELWEGFLLQDLRSAGQKAQLLMDVYGWKPPVTKYKEKSFKSLKVPSKPAHKAKAKAAPTKGKPVAKRQAQSRKVGK